MDLSVFSHSISGVNLDAQLTKAQKSGDSAEVGLLSHYNDAAGEQRDYQQSVDKRVDQAVI